MVRNYVTKLKPVTETAKTLQGICYFVIQQQVNDRSVEVKKLTNIGWLKMGLLHDDYSLQC
jgi:hypothetical protein